MFSELGKVLEHYAASVGESGPFHSHDLRDRVSQFGGGDTGSVGCAGQAVRPAEGGDLGGGQARRGTAGGYSHQG